MPCSLRSDAVPGLQLALRRLEAAQGGPCARQLNPHESKYYMPFAAAAAHGKLNPQQDAIPCAVLCSRCGFGARERSFCQRRHRDGDGLPPLGSTGSGASAPGEGVRAAARARAFGSAARHSIADESGASPV